MLYESPDPQRVFGYSPGIVRLASGRLVASIDIGGPGAADPPGVKRQRGEMGWFIERVCDGDSGRDS